MPKFIHEFRKETFWLCAGVRLGLWLSLDAAIFFRWLLARRFAHSRRSPTPTNICRTRTNLVLQLEKALLKNWNNLDLDKQTVKFQLNERSTIRKERRSLNVKMDSFCEFHIEDSDETIDETTGFFEESRFPVSNN